MSTINDFKKELKALLEKYNADINFYVGDGSDTHGLYDERMEVSFREGKSFKYKTHTLTHGWGINKSDL